MRISTDKNKFEELKKKRIDTERTLSEELESRKLAVYNKKEIIQIEDKVEIKGKSGYSFSKSIKEKYEKIKKYIETSDESRLKKIAYFSTYAAAHILISTLISLMFAFSGYQYFFPWNFFLPNDIRFIFLCFFLGAVISVRGGNYIYALLKKKFQPQKNIEGSARWQTFEEIKQRYVTIPKSAVPKGLSSGIIVASDECNYYIDKETVNSLIVGTTRSGKGQAVVLHLVRIISQTQDRHSFVVNDPKGEILEISYEMLKDKGYTIRVLNFRNTSMSSKWNPLSFMVEKYIDYRVNGGSFSDVNDFALNFADAITNDPTSKEAVWPSCAKFLLTAMLLYLLEKSYESGTLDKLNMFSVLNFFIEYAEKKVEEVNGNEYALDIMFDELPVGHPAKMAYASSNFARGEMRASIYSILANNLSIFSDVGIAEITAINEIDFRELINPDKPCAIFMVMPEEKQSRDMLATLFIDQCYTQLVDFSNDYVGQRLPQRVHLIFDEFGNAVPISYLEKKMTVALGRNILFYLFVQSISQIDERYGDKKAKTIMGACGNWIYINSIDQGTNELISKRLGNFTVEYETYNARFGGIFERNRSTNIRSRALMTPDELNLLESKGTYIEIVILVQRGYPIKSKIEPFRSLGIQQRHIRTIPVDTQKVDIYEMLLPFNDMLADFNDKGGFDEIPLPEDPKIPKPPKGKIAKPWEQSKRQELIDKINELTQGRFASMLEFKEFGEAKRLTDVLYKKDKKLTQAEKIEINEILKRFEKQE